MEWKLDLTLGKWASDALLAIFFFVAGVELKRELLMGSWPIAGRRAASSPPLGGCSPRRLATS